MSQYAQEIQNMVRMMDAIRTDSQNPQEITLEEVVRDRWGISMDSFYADLNIRPNIDTIQNLLQMPDINYRWLIPEIYRDALRLGLRKAPIYPNLISGEQSVGNLTVNMPAINMSDATPKKIGIAETIPLGDISFDQKQVKIFKVGRGIKIPDEVKNYVALNLVAIYMQDMGVKLGMALDYLCLITALNGDQADGSDSAPVLGIATGAGPFVYRDILKPWLRLARLGRNPSVMIAGEDIAMDLIDLFIATTKGLGTPRGSLNIKQTLPQSADMYIHGAISTNKVLLLDTSGALLKLNARPLMVESERIVSNQTEATYASITTGFATIFRDARVVIDKSLAFAGNGFPTYMDPAPFEVVPFTKGA